MIIISQNCLAGNLYRHHIKRQFPHPFVYCVIDYDSMVELIQTWENICFTDYRFSFETTPILHLGKNIRVQYVHYADICEAECKFRSRLDRMLNTDFSSPVFAICNHGTTFPDAIYTADQLNALERRHNVLGLRGLENLHPMTAAELFFNHYREVLHG